MTKFLFMLTHHDVTVANAIEVFQEIKNTGLECIGFKDIGLEEDELLKLIDLMKKEKMKIFLEVVSYSKEEHLKAAWGGEVWEKGFTLTLCYNAGNLPRRTACQILQENLLSINEKFIVNVQAMQWPSLLRGMYSALLPMFQIGWLPDFTDAHNFAVPFLHSQGTFSGWQNYSNPTADALIAQGIASTDPAERQSIYDQLGQIYYDDVPGILLAQPLGRRYMRDWVQGFYFNPALPSNLGNIYELSKSY